MMAYRYEDGVALSHQLGNCYLVTIWCSTEGLKHIFLLFIDLGIATSSVIFFSLRVYTKASFLYVLTNLYFQMNTYNVKFPILCV